MDKMNWKEVPYLFLTGSFEFQRKGGKRIPNNSFTNFQFADIDYEYVEISECTLIARPIKDLSDEEVLNTPTFSNNAVSRQWLSKHKDDIIETIEESKRVDIFLYLLSIGVYPFDQEKPEDVIWRYENG